jgi:hypothetical protein
MTLIFQDLFSNQKGLSVGLSVNNTCLICNKQHALSILKNVDLSIDDGCQVK